MVRRPICRRWFTAAPARQHAAVTNPAHHTVRPSCDHRRCIPRTGSPRARPVIAEPPHTRPRPASLECRGTGRKKTRVTSGYSAPADAVEKVGRYVARNRPDSSSMIRQILHPPGGSSAHPRRAGDMIDRERLNGKALHHFSQCEGRPCRSAESPPGGLLVLTVPSLQKRRVSISGSAAKVQVQPAKCTRGAVSVPLSTAPARGRSPECRSRDRPRGCVHSRRGTAPRRAYPA